MIRFDPTKVTFEIVRLKSVSAAMGGNIMVIDEAATVGKKEVLKRYDAPLAVTRDFIMSHKKVSKFLRPIYTCIVRYGTLVIALESHPLGALGELESEGFDGMKRRWEPAAQINYHNLVSTFDLSVARNWFFDGRYMYSFRHDNIEQAVAAGEYMTNDGSFRKVAVQSFDMMELGNKNKLVLDERSALAYVSKLGDITVSPPIWKKLEDVGGTQLVKAGVVSEDGAVMGNFDSIDGNLAVNLNFALKAGQEIGQTFGYEYIEPLQLPKLMIELCTVNLPNVSNEIKASYNIGMKFTHAIAWLLGMLRRADTLETTIIVRSLLKYLTKRGIFRHNMFNAAKIFKDGKTVSDVKAVSAEDLSKHDPLQLSLQRILEHARTKPALTF
jgi:hypothetical protein